MSDEKRKGVITKGIGGFYYVSYEGNVYECRGRGRLRKEKVKPMVGDSVLFTEGAVEEILPRVNQLIRPAVANITRLCLVVSAENPAPDFGLMDKITVMAEYNKINVIILVNKTDLKSASDVMEIYSKTPYKIYPISAKSDVGIEELKQLFSTGITAFAGNSGVGKSSILNSLGFDLQTGETSKIERGKHTTRHSELFPYKEGFIMDTPGFSILNLDEIPCEDLQEYMPDIKAFSGDCKFVGCDHMDSLSTVCAVAKASETGDISSMRYESYKKIFRELKEIKHY